MNVNVGAWISLPKDQRRVMLESVAQYQAEKRKKAAECANTQTT